MNKGFVDLPVKGTRQVGAWQMYKKHNTWRSHCNHTLQSQQASRERVTSTRRFPTNSQCHCAPCTEGHSTRQWARGVTCSLESISAVVGLPSDHRGYCPSLCSSLPSHNIKTVPLCACILGNLPPTMERALASAWEEYGAMERKNKGEGDRGEMENWQRGWRGKGEWRNEAQCLWCTDV